MRVLFLRPVLDSYGVSKVLLQLACELTKRGHDIIIASDNRDRFKAEVENRGITHYAIPLRSDRKNFHRFVSSVLCIARIVRAEKIDIIHSHHRWASFVSCFVSKLLNVPLVTTYHGIHQGKRWLTIWGNRVISVSGDARKHLIDCFHVNPHRIEVIHNGIEIPDLDEIERAVKNAKTLHERGSCMIANISRMSPEKDQKSLFYSMETVLRSYPEVCLYMVGTGSLEKELKTLAERLGIIKNIRFVGELEDVSQILASMDFLVLSSTTEGLPLAVLESLSYGKPVVATAVGDIPSVVIDQETGRLVGPGDADKLAEAIRFMIENRSKAQEMGRRGREMVYTNFNVQKMAAKTEEVYSSVLSVSGRVEKSRGICSR